MRADSLTLETHRESSDKLKDNKRGQGLETSVRRTTRNESGKTSRQTKRAQCKSMNVGKYRQAVRKSVSVAKSSAEQRQDDNSKGQAKK